MCLDIAFYLTFMTLIVMAKYNDLTLGQIEALVNKMGGEEAVHGYIRNESILIPALSLAEEVVVPIRTGGKEVIFHTDDGKRLSVESVFGTPAKTPTSNSLLLRKFFPSSSTGGASLTTVNLRAKGVIPIDPTHFVALVRSEINHEQTVFVKGNGLSVAPVLFYVGKGDMTRFFTAFWNPIYGYWHVEPHAYNKIAVKGSPLYCM
jgi:hypothetical protein